ncbi:MAG: hypothetical protein ACOYJS_04290 [Acutalibacteraceae bacterium]|jgi:hypothetical protein
MRSLNLCDYPRLAGEKDDAPRINRAVNDAPSGRLFIPGGHYYLASPVVVTNRCSIVMEENTLLEAIEEMDFVVVWDNVAAMKAGDPNYRNEIFRCAVRGGVIDGAGKASCLYLAGYKHFTLSDICFMNGKKYGLSVGDGYELIATNIYMKCLIKGLKGNIGLYTKHGDSHYTDVVITDYDIGLQDDMGGSNRYTRVHIWTTRLCDIENSVCFRLRCGEENDYGEVLLENCYADTGKIGFDIQTTTRLIGCSYYNNYKMFGLDDVLCVKNSTDKPVIISNCMFRKTSPKARFYEGNPNENVIFRDNIVDPGFDS